MAMIPNETPNPNIYAGQVRRDLYGQPLAIMNPATPGRWIVVYPNGRHANYREDTIIEVYPYGD